jgi:Ser/Thr protein kinase RdoA (MazF antagonist)
MERNEMNHDSPKLSETASSTPEISETHTLLDSIRNPSDAVPLPARSLARAWLTSTAGNTHVSRQLFQKAESQCVNGEELGHVLHMEALILHHSGDMNGSIEKAKECLDVSSRIGHEELEADALSHLAKVYETLGHKDLCAEYAQAATHMRAGTFKSS